PALVAAGEHAHAPAGQATRLRAIGQAAGAYIVAEAPGRIVLVEQQAAHERVLYERLAAQRAAGALERTLLDAPLSVELAETLHEAILGQRDALGALGFELEEFGAALHIRTLPAGFAPQRLAGTLTELAQHIIQYGAASQEWHDEALIVLAHHMAAAPGTVFTYTQMQSLLDDLARCARPETCPRGRPTLLMLDAAYLAQQFGRE
ncbi:MAG TPA: DNA mismatch repair protein MutL, partial [Roseiflexaceae bacterium]|nr:DNA mismatch repair protein MutL [Roseiflexaceae bacterium]